jgi:hypothetical protein
MGKLEYKSLKCELKKQINNKSTSLLSKILHQVSRLNLMINFFIVDLLIFLLVFNKISFIIIH